MGRWGPKNIESDASGIFLECDYAPRFLKARDHAKAWDYFFDEWSRYPAETQDECGVEHLLSVIELWVWEDLRAAQVELQRRFVSDSVEEHGPLVNTKHPGFLHSRLLYALAQLGQQAPSARTKERAIQLIDWNSEAVRRLEFFGGPQSKGGQAALRSLRKLRKALAGEGAAVEQKRSGGARVKSKPRARAKAGLRRFELTAGRSSKFWEILPGGDRFSVRYGRIGSPGRLQEKTFADEPRAQTAADKLIAEKIHKGYQEVSPS